MSTLNSPKRKMKILRKTKTKTTTTPRMAMPTPSRHPRSAKLSQPPKQVVAAPRSKPKPARLSPPTACSSACEVARPARMWSSPLRNQDTSTSQTIISWLSRALSLRRPWATMYYSKVSKSMQRPLRMRSRGQPFPSRSTSRSTSRNVSQDGIEAQSSGPDGRTCDEWQEQTGL